MMKKIEAIKILIMTAIIACMILLSGCSSSSNNVGPSTTPFVGGTTALSMRFVEGAPPNEIFDNKQFPFSINLQLENLGEYDVKASEGYIEITGIEPREFGLSGQTALNKNLDQIKGVVKNFQGTVITGETSIVEFNELNFQNDIRGNWDGPRIRANACYDYETEATAAVCLKRDMLTNIDTKEICELNGEKTAFNSGAPIQVTKVTQTPLGSDKIQVQFEVSHVGTVNDRFYKDGTRCDDRTTNTDKDKVKFEIITDINGKTAQCSGLDAGQSGSSGYITLYNGKPRNVICSFDTSSVDGVYEKQISVKLRYRYYQFIEKNILVKDVSTGQ